jgi:hypothetical protein
MRPGCLKIFLVFLFNVCTCFSQEYIVRVLHSTMVTEIGRPAYIRPGSNMPVFNVVSYIGSLVSAELVFVENNSVVSFIDELPLRPGEGTTLMFPAQSRCKRPLQGKFNNHCRWGRTSCIPRILLFYRPGSSQDCKVAQSDRAS